MGNLEYIHSFLLLRYSLLFLKRVRSILWRVTSFISVMKHLKRTKRFTGLKYFLKFTWECPAWSRTRKICRKILEKEGGNIAGLTLGLEDEREVHDHPANFQNGLTLRSCNYSSGKVISLLNLIWKLQGRNARIFNSLDKITFI